jgi:hypothetical protein
VHPLAAEPLPGRRGVTARASYRRPVRVDSREPDANWSPDSSFSGLKGVDVLQPHPALGRPVPAMQATRSAIATD